MLRTEQSQARIIGTLEKFIYYSHEVYERKMHRARLSCARRSTVQDHIWIIIPEDVMPMECAKSNLVGNKIEVQGVLRSRKEIAGDGREHWMLYVLACYVRICGKEESDENHIFLKGELAKKVLYRGTPLGRKIAELHVSVKRGYNKSAIIPCIAWGREADYVKYWAKGAEITTWGRLQSRIYLKQNERYPQEVYEVETFEVSVYQVT